MLHTRRHEQPIEGLSLFDPAELVSDLLVIVDRVRRRDRRVVPPMILDELAARVPEGVEIRARGVERLTRLRLGLREILGGDSDRVSSSPPCRRPYWRSSQWQSYR